MSERQSVVKIQTLTRSEYNLAKDIPNSKPLRKVVPENDGVSFPVPITSKPLITTRTINFEVNHRTQGEAVKSSHQTSGQDAVSAREISLATEMQRLVVELDHMKEEIEVLKRQNAILHDEKHFIINGYEDKIRELQTQDTARMELERRMRIFEQKKEKLEEELNRTRLSRNSLESQLEEFKRRAMESDDLSAQTEALLAERGYFENQFKQSVQNNDDTAISTMNVNTSVMEGERNLEMEQRTVMFMIEIERLGNIVGELQEELGLWRQQALELDGNAANEIEDAKKDYERIMSNRVENEIRNALEKFEAEKKSLELYLQGSQSRIHELQEQVKAQKVENEKLQQQNSNIARELQEWKFKHGQLEKGGEALRVSVEGEYRMGFDLRLNEKDELDLMNVERQRMKDQMNQKDRDIDQLNKKLKEHEQFVDKLRGEIQHTLRAEFESQMKDLTGRSKNSD